MGLEIETVYENGMLKPSQPLPLENGQRVRLHVQKLGSAVERFYGSLRWTGDPEEFDRWLNDPDEGIYGCHKV
ncbi:MAG: antitoxin family protein [Gemmataceae bacterium]|nr:antitoxin family protein [Gemmataceae bacterium]